MKYFSKLPKIYQSDFAGNYYAATNLMTRVNIIPEILSNPLLYYSYDIQDGDTPEIVAQKYYGSTDFFWVVLFSNQNLDPQWEWPLSNQNFEQYIIDKYGSLEEAETQIHHYEFKKTTQTSADSEVSEEIVIIDAAEYANVTPSSTSYSLTGETVTVTTDAYPVYAYTYELNENESRRSINLLDVKYLNSITQQFERLTEQ